MIDFMKPTIETFAKENNLPILNQGSQFPDYFATHAIEPTFDLTSTELKSSDELKHANLTTNIDKLLGTTNNVFFALGKGYLKSKHSIGLIYDPFIIAGSVGATMVLNDLMYILNDTQLLQIFCNKHNQEIKKIMDRKFSVEEQERFWQAVNKGESLLIGDEPSSPAHVFDSLLVWLPIELKGELSMQLKTDVVNPNVITNNLEQVIKDVFIENGRLMDSFLDKSTEERVVEIQVPTSYPIKKGLLAVYVT